MPLRNHEEICVFYKQLPTYNPQKVLGNKSHVKGKGSKINNNYGKFKIVDNTEKLGNMKYPKSIISFSKPHSSVCVHPTQKPTDLLEYLVKTYSNKNDTVLDFTMGSGSTGVACQNTNRKFIGIEKDKKYFKIAYERMKNNINLFKE
jgi:site-specific DNA-methyltransferase (adenine-specific)